VTNTEGELIMTEQKKGMEQTTNKVNIVGILVKNGLEKRNVGEENEGISGDLVLRTSDGSEHEINYFTNKYKKDENKNFTNDISKMYTGYETIIEEYQSLENSETPDIISVGFGEFSANDFVSQKDGSIVSTSKIRGKFANRLTAQEIEITPQVATFEVSGIITKLCEETYKNESTGNGTVMLDIIGYGGTIIPVRFTIPEELVTPFGSVGFYQDGTAKLSGKIINTKVSETITEKQAFGADLVKTVTVTKKRNEICGGSPLGTIYDLKITDDEYSASKAKRRLHLDEVKNKKNNQGQSNTETTTQTAFTNQPPVNNPFANPFVKK
jgi:hypothetical protein